ncbi:hypothetical protein LJR153_006114 [Paenibacillus sp. LjRoot153]|uniref:hypothetical protein n=1 Tax=Paenibacillus sp. LjRoot153 TaxID=3342270 RepID=UPI003ED12381
MNPIHRFGKQAIFAYLVIWFVGSLWMMAVLGSASFERKIMGIDFAIYHEYAIFGFAGSLGGALYGLRMFHEHYQELTTQWIYWYLMRPVLCFGSAIITIILFESGIMLLQVDDSMSARISIAFLTGYGYGKFMEKLRDLTATFFNGKNTNGTNGNGNGNGSDTPTK